MNELDILRNHFLGYHSNFFDNFKTVSTYPPYNIRGNEDKGVIEIALAGFTKDDLNVEIKDNLLHIVGKKKRKSKMTYGIEVFLKEIFPNVGNYTNTW